MIPPSKTRQILETARIEEVISDFLTLRRAGANLTTLCPFHHEKTPSFSVSPVRNTFKCFGCGKGGNAAKFLMEHEGYSFPEALRWLAKKYNIEILETKPTPEQLAAHQEEESLFILNDFALKFFQNQLPGAGLDYLKNRGFTDATIQEFGLGFAPDSWDALTKAATQAGFKLEQLQKLGLTTSSGKDFFRNRVIFPIHNLSGKVIAFAGRSIPNLPNSTNLTNSPKYLNSPESPIYHKSQTLYGIHHARKSIRQQDECILVEGYTDLIALHQAGIENVVASAGTALTTEQLLLIRRFTPNLHILYDGDLAGIAAAMRGLDLALELDLNVKVTPLPHPDDPDSFLRRLGIAAFTEYLATSAKDFITFKASILLTDVANDPVKKATAVHSIVDSIARVADPIKRSFFIKECASFTGLSEAILTAETNKAVLALPLPSATFLGVRDKPGVNSPLEPVPTGREVGGVENHLVYLLLEHGADILDPKENITVAEHILAHTYEVLEHFEDPRCQRICRESIELVLAKKTVNAGHFIAHEDLDLSSFVSSLMHKEDAPVAPNWEQASSSTKTDGGPSCTEDITKTILQLRLKALSQLCEQNLMRIRNTPPDDEQALARLLKVHEKLITARRELAESLGLVRF
ncbi:MAG: DNA primase [Saprospiraceae bacterium]|nr:DNA primase [Saprospiraceae bacterium]